MREAQQNGLWQSAPMQMAHGAQQEIDRVDEGGMLPGQAIKTAA